jgi:hypothetical protein
MNNFAFLFSKISKSTGEARQAKTAAGSSLSHCFNGKTTRAFLKILMNKMNKIRQTAPLSLLRLFPNLRYGDRLMSDSRAR